jgi:dethiobiotin synthetase
MKPIIITGINTDVGKTVIAAGLTEKLKGYYWKPIQCGKPHDREWVERRLSIPNRTFPEKYCFEKACSPHAAGRVEIEELVLPFCPGQLIIEGPGGLLAPLTDKKSFVDAFALLDAYWIVVHRHYLGSLNHFLLTIEAMKQRKLNVLGVVFNGPGDLKTEEMLLKRTHTRCLARVAWQELTNENIQKMGEQWDL